MKKTRRPKTTHPVLLHPGKAPLLRKPEGALWGETCRPLWVHGLFRSFPYHTRSCWAFCSRGVELPLSVGRIPVSVPPPSSFLGPAPRSWAESIFRPGLSGWVGGRTLVTWARPCCPGALLPGAWFLAERPSGFVALGAGRWGETRFFALTVPVARFFSAESLGLAGGGGAKDPPRESIPLAVGGCWSPNFLPFFSIQLPVARGERGSSDSSAARPKIGSWIFRWRPTGEPT